MSTESGPSPSTLAPIVPGYEALTPIGKGASSVVFKAVEASTGATVAVKVLHPHLATDEVSVERFKRELRLTRALQHPQIAAGIDLVATESGLALVMEYVEGETLKELIRAKAPLPAERALEIARELLQVLKVCHREDVIHRDLKPQNIMVDANGRIKLLDFGIARMTGLRDLTRTGTTLGSPEYMAPELFDSGDFDPRGDLYAVGVVLYEMLTGSLPYQADSALLFVDAHREAVAPLAAHRSDPVDEWLEQFVHKLIAVDAHERYQTAEEALTDLESERVIAAELPAMDTRRCLSCGELTIAELLICARCGYDGLETFQPGRYDVVLSEDYDADALDAFLRDYRITRPAAGTGGARDGAPPSGIPLSLARSVDKESAELLKRSAQRHGLYVDVQKRSWLAGVGPTVSLFVYGASVSLVVVSPFIPWFINMDLLRALYPETSNQWMDLLRLGADVLILTVGFVLLAMAALRHYRRVRVPPLLRVGAEVKARLKHDYGWMQALAPHLEALRPGPMRELSAKLIGRYVLLRRQAPRWDVALGERLQSVLLDAVRSASMVSELDEAAHHPALQMWERRLSPRTDELDANVGVVLDAGDARSRLKGRLAELSYLFNRIAGKAIVLDATQTEVDIEEIAAASAGLERELTAASEARAELDAIL